MAQEAEAQTAAQESAAEPAVEGPTVEELALELERARALADDYRQTLQRLKADFDNYRKRVAQDQERWQQMAVAGLALEVLPAIDNLERALGASGDPAAVRQGVELTVRQLRDVLAASGIRPFEAVGQPFDPTRHEAVARGAVPGVPEGHVAEEYRRGYLIGDQVLRPALVKVAQAEVAQETVGQGAETPEKEGENHE